jgi:hypothetical protein
MLVATISSLVLETDIGGLSVLHFFQAKSEALTLCDLDIYAAREFKEEVLEHLKVDEGYMVMMTAIHKVDYIPLQ